tara:strand:+ start:4415 stop:5038 length:624 start_codon:yes stop_codon:yes gene_type:complete
MYTATQFHPSVVFSRNIVVVRALRKFLKEQQTNGLPIPELSAEEFDACGGKHNPKYTGRYSLQRQLALLERGLKEFKRNPETILGKSEKTPRNVSAKKLINDVIDNTNTLLSSSNIVWDNSDDDDVNDDSNAYISDDSDEEENDGEEQEEEEEEEEKERDDEERDDEEEDEGKESDDEEYEHKSDDENGSEKEDDESSSESDDSESN